MYTVTVLTPQGRRQQVKVTPNTTLLQILEEVCSKHGFNPQEYDLRHHNKILDVSSMFRFTSLPNNAQLEMTEALKTRQESPVTLGLQFESGERVTGVFSPSESIWNIIVSLSPEEEISKNLVVIYMRNEIYGKENLKATTLRSLGLTSGRAMLRILHRAPEDLHIQANVSSDLPPRIALSGGKKKESSKSDTPKKVTLNEKQKTPPPEAVRKKTPPPEPKPQTPEPVRKETTPEPVRKEAKYQNIITLRENVFENLLKEEKAKRALLGYKDNTAGTSSSGGKENVDNVYKSLSESKVKMDSSAKGSATTVREEKEKSESKVILLGERNAVAYSLNSVKPALFEEEPDDFYDLTIYDAKLLLKQAKQLCADLEDAPLMTSAQRELEKDKKVLSLLSQYKRTVLRIKFPDRTVLQGTFSSLETVSAVEKFVSDYLELPKLKFYLYTTPPKVILKSDTRLIECGCVPSCVLYFGMPPDVAPPSMYLKADVLEKLSTPSAAALHAYESRKMERKKVESTSGETEKQNWSDNEEAGPSGSQDWDNNPRDQENSVLFKLPKWFRTNK